MLVMKGFISFLKSMRVPLSPFPSGEACIAQKATLLGDSGCSPCRHPDLFKKPKQAPPKVTIKSVA